MILFVFLLFLVILSVLLLLSLLLFMACSTTSYSIPTTSRPRSLGLYSTDYTWRTPKRCTSEKAPKQNLNLQLISHDRPTASAADPKSERSSNAKLKPKLLSKGVSRYGWLSKPCGPFLDPHHNTAPNM